MRENEWVGHILAAGVVGLMAVLPASISYSLQDPEAARNQAAAGVVAALVYIMVHYTGRRSQ